MKVREVLAMLRADGWFLVAIRGPAVRVEYVEVVA
jgi:predicted RNA binding protein YcfA (HicA-like mRNA interferase family)